MKKTLLACAAAMLLSAPAIAADLRMPVKAPAYAPVFNWTGFYVGGFIGLAGASGDAESTEPSSAGVNLFTVGGAVTNNSYSLDTGFIGGATLGYNWQAPGSSWVFGIEGEIGYINLDETVRDVNAAAAAPGTVANDSTKIGDWYGVIAGRIGYAFDRVLVYGKGGIAFVDKSYTYESNAGIAGSINISRDDVQVTWALGVGAEWAFAPNWSLKAEYLYIDTKESYDVSAPISGGLAPGAVFTTTHTDPGLHTGKIGINYRF
jgi:outer membrane immunogenic protein